MIASPQALALAGGGWGETRVSSNVLIVGAGPVGLTLAVELARYGVAVRIVDKAPARTDKSKAVAVWSRSLELLDRIGIAATIVAAGLPVRAADISTGSERIARVTLDGLDSAFDFVLMIPQSETERILEETLNGFGVTVERSTTLKEFTAADAGVEAVVVRADGTEETIAADWLVGCDGAHSLVRHTLGFAFAGDTVDDTFLLADIRLSGDLPKDELVTFWHPRGLVVLMPLPGGRCRLIASDDRNAAATEADPQLADIQAVLDERGPGGLVASDPVWLTRFRVNERKVDNYRAGRVFLAGDAAHVHSPAGGQGMTTGMQDAFNLAWKLALVARGEADRRLLDSYSVERSAVAAAVIADAGRLTRIAMLDGALKQHMRNFVVGHLLGLSVVQHGFRERLSELGVAYDHSPLSGTAIDPGRLPRPGHRMPPGDGPPIGAGPAPRFAALAAGVDANLAALGKRHRRLVEDRLRPPAAPGSIVLVRPDGYVALIAEAGDWTSVDAYLASLV